MRNGNTTLSPGDGRVGGQAHPAQRFGEIISTYEKHGWTLKRVLLSSGTRDLLADLPVPLFEEALLREGLVDALWFARSSPEGREAWELRLVGDTPYALFELFEADETEEDREEVRREMESKLCEHACRDDQSS
jgi:hypothetical protein